MSGLEDDDTLWRKVTQSVKPLPGRQRPAAPAIQVPIEEGPASDVGRQAHSRPRLAGAPRGPGGPKPLEPGAADGLDKRQADRLKRGLLAIEGRLDLHGLTQREAHAELDWFLARSQDRRQRVVLLITGKGQKAPLEERTSVLRRQVPHWLNEPSMRRRIVAFCSAQPKHGGDGAFYIYLKKTQ